MRIGEDSAADPVFARIQGLALDDMGGVVVSDAGTHEVRAFDNRGRERFKVGRRGQGPGEYESPSFTRFDDQGRLWIVSLGDLRLLVFELAESAEHVATIRMRSRGSIAGAPIPDGDTIRVPVYPPGRLEDADWLYAYRSIDWEGQELSLQPLARHPLTDSVKAGGLLEIPRPNRDPIRVWGFEPFAAFGITALGPEGHHARVLTSRYAIEIFDADLTEVAHIRVDVTPPLISSLERDSAEASLEEYRSIARQQNGRYEHPEIGTHKPVVRRIWFDSQNRIWVERNQEHDPDSRWADVFTVDGKPLFRAHWPVNISLAWGAARDSIAAGVEWDVLEIPRPVLLLFR